MTNPFSLSEIQDSTTQDTRNPYSLEAIQGEARTDLRQSLISTEEVNPDQAAHAARLSRQVGAPYDAVQANLHDVEQKTKLDAYERMLANSPRLEAFMRNPQNAQIAHDDVDNLGGIERVLRQFGGGAIEAAGMQASGFSELYGVGERAIVRSVRSLFGDSAAEFLTTPAAYDPWLMLQQGGKDIKHFARDQVMVPADQRTFGDDVAAGLGQVAGQLVMLLFTRGAGLYAQGADVMAEKVEQDSADQGAKDLAILGGAAVTGITEKWALDRLLGPLAGPIKNQIGATLARIGVAAAAEGGQEFTENVLQDALRKVLINPDAEIDLGQSAYEGGVGAAVGGIVRSIVEAGLHVRARGAQRSQQAEQDVELIDNLNKLAASNKVLARDPETFEQFIAQAAEGSPVQKVFIDAQTLMQSGVAEQVAAVSPSVAAQFPAALQTGGQIAIPVEEYTTRIAPTEYSQGLLDHLKVDPEGFSRAEGREWNESGAREEFERNAESILTEKQGDEVFKASQEAVKAQILTELNALGRFTSAKNEADATLFSSYYAVRAAQMGVTPEQLFEQRRIRFAAESLGGVQFDQAALESPEFKAWFGGSKMVDAEGKPLVVYHGTRRDFSQFRSSKQANDLLFFSQDPEVASGYATRGGGWESMSTAETQTGIELFLQDHPNPTDEDVKNAAGVDLPDWFESVTDIRDLQADLAEGANVMPVYLRAENPMGTREKPIPWREAELLGAEGIRDRGYDSVWVKEKDGVAIAVIDPSQIKSVNNQGTFDPNDPNILHQSGITPTEQVVQKWKAALSHVHPNKLDYVSKLDTPAVLRSLGVKESKLELPTRYLMRIRADHPDVPVSVFENLPALISDPLFILPHREGGITVILDATTEAGSPIAVGVRDGRVRTVTPLDGEGRVAAMVERALSYPGKIYARNKKALDNAKASSIGAPSGLIPLQRESLNNAGASPATIAMQRNPRNKARITTRDDLVKKLGNEFYQSQQGARGAFNPETFTIAILKGADLSTTLHEGAHFFFENDIRLAAELIAKNELTAGEQQIVDDVSRLMRWHGIQGDINAQLEQWNNLSFEEKRAHHERIAESFERYLTEGKAPSIELQSYFQKFRAWMLNVYRSITDFLARHPEAGKLSDEVRGVFDRMLATNEQITLAEQGRSMMPLFASPDKAGMTPEEFAAYQALGTDATNDAIQDVQARALRDMQWLHNARGRVIRKLKRESKALRAEVRQQVAEEVRALPVYRAWSFLTGKETDGGATVGKLSRAALDEMYGGFDEGKRDKYALLDWKRLTDLRMTAEDGLHPDMVADLIIDENGTPMFSSGDEMVRKLLTAEKPDVEIEALTDVRMLEQYGELNSPEAIEKAADIAIHNDARARFVATEANALLKATGQRKILLSAAKEFARAAIARLKVRDIKPGQYASAEVRAAKASDKAFKAGDIATAAAEKRNQVVQQQLTRAAYDAQSDMEALRRKLSDIARRADKRIGKTHDLDMVNAVRAILGAYDIAPKSGKSALEYLEKLKGYDADTYQVVESAVNTAQLNAKPFRDLTVEEARGLGEEIDAILHLARRSRQMEVDGDLIDRQEAEDALRARMEEIGVPDTMPGENSAITPGEEFMLKFKTAIAAGRRVESWAGFMDGEGSPVGPFRRFIWNKIKDAATAYRVDKTTKLKEFRALLDSIAPTLKPLTLAAPELNYTFGADTSGSGIAEILHALLHTGNASNKRKLLLGRKWATLRLDGSLDTSRWDTFVTRMIQEGRITKAHFDFVQGVWDLMESMKPLAQKTHRDVFGKYFEEIAANEVTTPFGIYRGGYVPAMVDSRIVGDAALRKLAETENASMAYAFPTTAKGFTKSRTEYNRPLLLDLRSLAQHIDQVLLFSHMEMPVRDVQRLVGSVNGTLNRIDPAAIPGMLTPWLNRSARQQVVTPIQGDAGMSRFFTVLRARAGAAAMFANVTNTAQQITGFAIASVKVKPRLLKSAAADYIKKPRVFSAAVAEASPYMAERMENEISAMNDGINDVLLNPSKLQQAQAWSMRHAYFMQAAVDNVMSPIVWTAAYNQALEQGANHADAVRLADGVVRETQGSQLPEDISRIESGPAWARLFTQFAGYFNMQANLLGHGFAALARDYGLRRGASRGVYLLGMGLLAPAIVSELIVQLGRGGPDDEDDDGYLDDWLAAAGMGVLRNVAAMVPGGGQFVMAMINAWNDKPYDDRLATSPAISMIENAAKAGPSVWRAATGEGSSQKAVRDVGTLISLTVGLPPASAAARPLGYAAGIADDRIRPTGPVDVARGLVTGVASPDSKR